MTLVQQKGGERCPKEGMEVCKVPERSDQLLLVNWCLRVSFRQTKEGQAYAVWPKEGGGGTMDDEGMIEWGIGRCPPNR
jgi:hypothetical protein